MLNLRLNELKKKFIEAPMNYVIPRSYFLLVDGRRDLP